MKRPSYAAYVLVVGVVYPLSIKLAREASRSWRRLLSRYHVSWIQKDRKSSSLVIRVGRDGEPENKPSVVVGLADANALAAKSSLIRSQTANVGRVGLELGFCKPLPPGPKSTVVATGDEHGSPRVHHARSNSIPSFRTPTNLTVDITSFERDKISEK